MRVRALHTHRTYGALEAPMIRKGTIYEVVDIVAEPDICAGQYGILVPLDGDSGILVMQYLEPTDVEVVE